jgi:hypothetical protein
MVPDIIHECDLSIIFQFVNIFSSYVFLHWYYSYRLRMDESKSETNVKSCGECVVIHYIFSVMYGKIVFVVMDNKSVSVNRSKCLISYIKCCCFTNQNTKYYTERVACDLCFTRCFYVLCNPSLQSILPICRLI